MGGYRKGLLLFMAFYDFFSYAKAVIKRYHKLTKQ